MYLPKSKYTGPLYTPEGVYVYEDGTPFKGWFILTYRGEAYEGLSPQEAETKILLKAVYEAQNKIKVFQNSVLHYLEPADRDYRAGYVYRYFLKMKSSNVIKEVSKAGYSRINVPFIEKVQITWNLTGPVDDTKIGSYIKEGAASKNKKVVEAAEQKMQGISQYITDYGEFVK